jgi:DNA-binding GntR family transcriptional regulator
VASSGFREPAASPVRVELEEMGGVGPVGPDRTVEQVLVRSIRTAIVDGTFPPGVRLPYRELAQQFNVSVTPVRIALKELANQGLVEIRPHGGASVTSLSQEEVEELYVSRIALECWLAQLGAPRLTDDNVAQIATRFVDVEQAVSSRDRRGYLDATWEVRTICYRAAERPRILDAISLLWQRSARYNYLTVGPDFRLDESMAGSREFYAACMERDGQRAPEAIRRALQRTFDYLLETLPHST